MSTLAPILVQANTLPFLQMGDWGGQDTAPFTTPSQLNVAKAMSQYSHKFQPQFLLSAGDNFYEKGVESIFSTRFNDTFNNVYTDVDLEIPWYIIAGNHDHEGDIMAQIMYTFTSNRWFFPNFWYTFNYTFGDEHENAIIVQFINIDTVILAGQWTDDDGWLPVPDEFQSQTQIEMDWIEQQLNNSTADWIIVTGHYPVFSVAEHGPNSFLVDWLKPLLEKFGVATYLCGHEHDMEHLIHKNVNYIVNGAGHELDVSTKHIKDVPEGSLKFIYPTKDDKVDVKMGGGFTSLEIFNKREMKFSFLDQNATVIYSYTIVNPRLT